MFQVGEDGNHVTIVDLVDHTSRQSRKRALTLEGRIVGSPRDYWPMAKFAPALIVNPCKYKPTERFVVMEIGLELWMFTSHD